MALLTVDERNFFLENDSFSRRAHSWTDLWCLLAAGVEEKADADAKEMSTLLNFMVAKGKNMREESESASFPPIARSGQLAPLSLDSPTR